MAWYNPFDWFEQKRTFDVAPKYDPRSNMYPVRAILPYGVKPVTKMWKCSPRLNQGKEGACVGFGIAHEVAAEPVPRKVDGRIARLIYKRAQQLDKWPGEDYSGTSVLAGMKAGKEAGYYDEYRWAFGLGDLQVAVGHLGPAILGIDWYTGMQKTDAFGQIHKTGHKTGGHCVCCIGYDLKTKRFKLRNSWGRRWGWMGDCWISEIAMAQLLNSGGVAAIPVIRRGK